MHYLKELESSLEAVTANATAVLEYLRSLKSDRSDGTGLPADLFDGAPKHTDIARKALTDASSKLAELSIRPAEYLDHLANGVSFSSALPV
jgi:hypothetical protein